MDTYVTITDEMRVKSMEVFEKVGNPRVKPKKTKYYMKYGN